jgi:hypothetical protein
MNQAGDILKRHDLRSDGDGYAEEFQKKSPAEINLSPLGRVPRKWLARGAARQKPNISALKQGRYGL